MNEAVARPHEPISCTADLPGVGGRLGSSPDDFVVDEIPAFPASGQGEHLFVQLRKRSLTTQELVAAVANVARVPARDIGYAGMKDKHAVTTQWLSLPPRALEPSSWQLPPGVELVEASRHERKLRTGQLRGNRFRVRLVDTPGDALTRARAICERIAARGLPNYFGEQRFGRGGFNLQEAMAWLARGGQLRGGRSRLLRKLYPSVIQSEVFNRYLTARMQLGLDRLLPGEVVRLEGSASLFVVEDPERERSRLAVRDIHTTGPLPGPRALAATGAARALESEVELAVGLGPAELATLGAHAPGARRDLLVWPGDLEVTEAEPGSIWLSFFLPAGSFATQLLRELTRAGWLEARRIQ